LSTNSNRHVQRPTRTVGSSRAGPATVSSSAHRRSGAGIAQSWTGRRESLPAGTGSLIPAHTHVLGSGARRTPSVTGVSPAARDRVREGGRETTKSASIARDSAKKGGGRQAGGTGRRQKEEQKEVDRVRELLARAFEDLGMVDTLEASGWVGIDAGAADGRDGAGGDLDGELKWGMQQVAAARERVRAEENESGAFAEDVMACIGREAARAEGWATEAGTGVAWMDHSIPEQDARQVSGRGSSVPPVSRPASAPPPVLSRPLARSMSPTPMPARARESEAHDLLHAVAGGQAHHRPVTHAPTRSTLVHAHAQAYAGVGSPSNQGNLWNKNASSATPHGPQQSPPSPRAAHVLAGGVECCSDLGGAYGQGVELEQGQILFLRQVLPSVGVCLGCSAHLSI